MTRFKLIGAAAVLSMLSATPALAQHMIDEPGMFAFTYPMGDLGIASSPRPPTDARAAILMNGGNATPAFGTRIVQRPGAVRHIRSGK
jgi:hypothetical protein